MKIAVNVLIAGWVLGALTVAPNALGKLSATTVEAAPALASISGTVKDERGVPLAGAFVALLEPQPRGKELKSVKTDNQGKFSALIEPGVYWLRAAAEGFVALRTRVILDRAGKANYEFALKRAETLVQKRGDSDDYRWIARSAPRHAMNLIEENGELIEDTTGQITASNGEGYQDSQIRNSLTETAPSFHGVAQFFAAGSSSRYGQPGPSFFGSNFALSGSLGGNIEMAVIGQGGAGQLAPQRLEAIATMRPSDRHQVTASIGYGQVALASPIGPVRGLARKTHPDFADLDRSEMAADFGGATAQFTPVSGNQLQQRGPQAQGPAGGGQSLDQLSVSAVASWQVFQPLLVIYGFDYSRFMGSAARQRDSVLPRFAVQYAPSARTRLNASVTPGADQNRQSIESFNTENLQTTFENSPAEVASNDSPILDRSRRFEIGFEHVFGNGESSLEASAFYDLISGHGVGVLALPLEASPETQATFQQVAHQITAMNGAARGARVMYKRQLNDHVTASAGYSFGRGSRFNNAPLETINPGQLFRGGYFQVATARVDLDFTHETGTRISTVIRLSPSAVVFAIDPFAGRMSVYDPNINIYVTQELPNFGLPVRWEALVDLRNLLDQTIGAEDGPLQLISARTRRSVRGGVAFRW